MAVQAEWRSAFMPREVGKMQKGFWPHPPFRLRRRGSDGTCEGVERCAWPFVWKKEK